jgi:PadR family transcriptional regulator PadR
LATRSANQIVFKIPNAAEGMRFQLDTDHYYHHNVIVIMLGEFEYLLITAAARLGDDAYGAAIRLEIEGATKRRCSIGALYTTLDRLEAKGFLKTWMGDPTPQRGGRPKRMVRVTAKGIQAATTFYDAVTRVSRGVSWEANRVVARP